MRRRVGCTAPRQRKIDDIVDLFSELAGWFRRRQGHARENWLKNAATWVVIKVILHTEEFLGWLIRKDFIRQEGLKPRFSISSSAARPLPSGGNEVWPISFSISIFDQIGSSYRSAPPLIEEFFEIWTEFERINP